MKSETEAFELDVFRKQEHGWDLELAALRTCGRAMINKTRESLFFFFFFFFECFTTVFLLLFVTTIIA